MRIFAAMMLSALALAACERAAEKAAPAPSAPARTPPRAYEGVAIGWSHDDLYANVGQPNLVRNDTEFGPTFAVDPADRSAPPMQGAVEDYPQWVYASPTRELAVTFNTFYRVHRVRCMALAENGCGALDGVAMGGTQADVLAVVGGPAPTAPPDSTTTKFANRDDTTAFYMQRGRVIGAEISVANPNPETTAAAP